MTVLKNLLKALISFALLAYLIYLADPHKVWINMGRIWYDGGAAWLVLAVTAFIVAQYMLAVRWQVLVRGYGITISTRTLFKYYMIGLFFNNFLPTAIGGDVFRIYNLIRYSGERTIGFASVLTERLLGITTTLIMAVIAMTGMPHLLPNMLPLLAAVGMLLFIAFLFLMVLNDHLFGMIQPGIARITIFRLGERLLKFIDAVRFYRSMPGIYLRIMILSLMSQVLVVFMTFFIIRAMSLDVAPGYLFIVVPISFLLVMLPSINGIGFREGTFVVMLGYVGVTKAAALSVSFFTILIPMAVSIAGGLLFVLNRKLPEKEELEIVEKNI